MNTEGGRRLAKAQGTSARVDGAYLVDATAAGVVADLDPRVDRRREGSAFLRTVFIRSRTFPKPFFSFSFSLGTEGPSWAGELMVAA